MKNSDNNKKSRYVTIDDGIDFRSIASLMTEANYQMNHATARNVMVSAMGKFLTELSQNLDSEISPEKMADLLKDPELHSAFADILYVAYKGKSSNN